MYSSPAPRRVKESDLAEVHRLRLAFLDESELVLRPDAVAAWRDYDILWWNQFIHRCATSPEEYLAVVPSPEHPDALLALGYAHHTGSVVTFGMLYVDPPYRGRGFGAAVLEHRTLWALRTGALSMECWITDGNVVATDLHESEGWQRTDTTRVTNPPATETLWEFPIL